MRGVIRRKMASDLANYRRHRSILELPKIRRIAFEDAFAVGNEHCGAIYFTPVFRLDPTIGTGRTVDMRWRASVEYIHPASYWHSEEADEAELCDGRNLIEAVFCSIQIMRLDCIQRMVSESELYRVHCEGELH